MRTASGLILSDLALKSHWWKWIGLLRGRSRNNGTDTDTEVVRWSEKLFKPTDEQNKKQKLRQDKELSLSFKMHYECDTSTWAHPLPQRHTHTHTHPHAHPHIHMCTHYPSTLKNTYIQLNMLLSRHTLDIHTNTKKHRHTLGKAGKCAKTL